MGGRRPGQERSSASRIGDGIRRTCRVARAAAFHPSGALALLLLLGALIPVDARAQCVNGQACDDGSVCTTGDVCIAGVCIGTAISCPDDGNVCTTAACNPTTGCFQTNNTSACDDGNLCTLSDACSGGFCGPGAPRDCNDSNVCTTDSCAPATGSCSFVPNAASCNDGNACTTGDVCAGGSCQPGATPLVCNDGNACTTDSCNPLTGCAFPSLPNGTACNDASVCTTGDRCASGVCLGNPITCPDDANGCTTTACNPTSGCFQANNTAPCDDANGCTLNDACSGGLCRPGAPRDCSDGNVCTTDSCAPATGACSSVANAASCNDGNACTTGDVCAGGSCQPGATPLACNDGNACTTNGCNPTSGCIFPNAPNGTACSDGSICTNGDACTNGSCGGTPIGCPDDGNVCTTAACNPTSGCFQANNTAPCDDANGCTLNDACNGGLCRPGAPRDCNDANDCTSDACNTATGACEYANATGSCSDGNPCTLGDACLNGSCTPSGPPLECPSASNPCQIGSCDPVAGCVFANAPPGTSCVDGNACTASDVCTNGVCSGTPIPNCSPAAVPTLTDWSRVALVALLATTALALSTHGPRRRLRRAQPPPRGPQR